MNQLFKLGLIPALTFIFISAAGQDNLSQNKLENGGYRPGFTATWKIDYTRTWGQSELVQEDYAANKPYGRPVRISTWYPIESASGGKPMTMQDYLYISSSDPTSEKAQAIIVTKDIGDKTKSIKGLFSGDEKAFQQFLNNPSSARLNAAPAKGKKFPLLVYSLGQNDYSFENIVLFEYLATKGFVVVCVPHLGVNPRKDYLLVDEPLSFETQLRDMEFALSESLQLPFVNGKKIGTLGMSFGTIYSLLLAGRNNNIKAIAGLDGTVMGGLEPYAYKYWQSPFYDSANIKVPMLQIFRQGHNDFTIINSLIYSEKYLIEAKNMVHADFTSYPIYTQDIAIKLLDSFALSRRTPQSAVNSYKNLCVAISNFFESSLNNPSNLNSEIILKGIRDHENLTTQLLDGIDSPNEEEFAKIILNKGADYAIDLYKTLQNKYPGKSWLRQKKINRMGYEMIYNNKIEEAISIFKFNVAVFPDSPDTHDSLAEAFKILNSKK